MSVITKYTVLMVFYLDDNEGYTDRYLKLEKYFGKDVIIASGRASWGTKGPSSRERALTTTGQRVWSVTSKIRFDF